MKTKETIAGIAMALAFSSAAAMDKGMIASPARSVEIFAKTKGPKGSEQSAVVSFLSAVATQFTDAATSAAGEGPSCHTVSKGKRRASEEKKCAAAQEDLALNLSLGLGAMGLWVGFSRVAPKFGRQRRSVIDWASDRHKSFQSRRQQHAKDRRLAHDILS